MYLDGFHEKGIFGDNCPFRVIINSYKELEYPPHWHNAVELVYAKKNGCEVNVNGGNIPLEERDILIIAGGDIHAFTADKVARDGERILIQFDIPRLDCLDHIKNLIWSLTCTRVISLKNNVFVHDEIEQHICKIVTEYKKMDTAYEMSINARIFDIIVVLIRNFLKNTDTDDIKEANNLKQNRKRLTGLEKLNNVFQYIEENYLEDITLDDVSRAVGFSKCYLSRIFNEITEKSFNTYLNSFRIKKAEKLIMDSSITITEVAHSVGFNSTGTFNRVFRQIKGCSPSEYRKMLV